MRKKAVVLSSVGVLALLLGSWLYGLLFGKAEPLINSYLVSAKVSAVEHYDSKSNPAYKHTHGLGHVRNVEVRVDRVYVAKDSDVAVGDRFKLLSHSVQPLEDEDGLTILGYHDGIFEKRTVPIGKELICLVVKAKEFSPDEKAPEKPMMHVHHSLEHFLLCPKYSVFYSLFEPMLIKREGFKEWYQIHVEWAEEISAYQHLPKSKRLKILREWIEGENPLLAVHAVHLTAREFPAVALRMFPEGVNSSNLKGVVRVAMDQELYLNMRSDWLNTQARANFLSWLETKPSEDSTGLNLYHRHEYAMGMMQHEYEQGE